MLKGFTFPAGPRQQEKLLLLLHRALQKETYMQNVNNVLSLVTRAHHCAAFIRVEMICANKERRPSSNTLLLLFHLRIANEHSLLTWSLQAVSQCLQSGLLLTAGCTHTQKKKKTWSTNSWRMMLDKHIPLHQHPSPLRSFTLCRAASSQGHNKEMVGESAAV